MCEGGGLIYVGRVGTGWDRKTAAAIRSTLAPLARTKSALAKPIKRADTIWIEPRFDAEIGTRKAQTARQSDLEAGIAQALTERLERIGAAGRRKAAE